MLIDQEFADRMNRMTPEQIAEAVERLRVLEWGVGFEALAHVDAETK